MFAVYAIPSHKFQPSIWSISGDANPVDSAGSSGVSLIRARKMINEANLSAVYGHDQKVFTDQSGGAVKVGAREKREKERQRQRERERARERLGQT